ncbi:MAG: peptidoglycan-N-acetylglucosamine deacetylase [Actinomycetota bacterium]|nr:peptidoglycan-N-acetylglucosamine deacetylase [Actinomycetota bacterium]
MGEGGRTVRPLRRAAATLSGLLVACGALLQVSHAVSNEHFDGIAPICRVSTAQRIVALSFDDGPDPAYTPAVLALLHANNSSATFFVVGERADAYPALVETELAGGMEIGDHTWTHPHLNTVTAADAITQATETRALLANQGAAVQLFRPPYGEISPAALTALAKSGFRSVVWSYALDHYVGGLGLAPPQAANTLAGDVEPGDIILAHDAHLLPVDGGGARTSAMDALQLLVPALVSRGFRIVSVGDLLAQGSPVRAVPRRWFWESGFTCPH